MKIVLFANTDWYLYNFRRSLANAIRDSGHEVILVSPPGPYGEKLRELCFRWIPAPMVRSSLNPLREAALLAWLWRLLRQERPDVLHAFTIKCAVYGALVGRLTGVGRINAVVGMGYVFTSGDLKARLLRPAVRGLMRAALGGKRTRLIVQNPDDAAFFNGAGLVSPDLVRLIPGSGVDCARFAFSDVSSDVSWAERRSEAPLCVVLAARLLWDKGLKEFVEAARLLKGEKRPVQFMLAGAPDPGNPASVPEKAILGWQEAGWITWLGQVSNMPELYARADIVVLPSYREGLPKSLIEAAACGKPLVTTDVPGCREVVRHEVDGLLVPARDARALARAIARLQDDPALARRLGRAARAKALLEFDERIVIARTLAVYDEVLAGKGAPGRLPAS